MEKIQRRRRAVKSHAQSNYGWNRCNGISSINFQGQYAQAAQPAKGATSSKIHVKPLTPPLKGGINKDHSCSSSSFPSSLKAPLKGAGFGGMKSSIHGRLKEERKIRLSPQPPQTENHHNSPGKSPQPARTLPKMPTKTVTKSGPLKGGFPNMKGGQGEDNQRGGQSKCSSGSQVNEQRLAAKILAKTPFKGTAGTKSPSKSKESFVGGRRRRR